MERSKPRERILAAATRLFYEEGIHATGMDRVIAEAGVAPMTVYRQFGNKDGVLLATLTRWSDQWLGWLGTEMAHAGPVPAARLDALWDALEKWFAAEGFRGSYIANVATELRSKPNHPAHETVAAHRAALRQLLHDIALAAAVPHPEDAALHLHMLIDGAVAVAVVDRHSGAVTSARALATSILPATSSGVERPTR